MPPAPPGPAPSQCTGTKNWNCANNGGFCLNQVLVSFHFPLFPCTLTLTLTPLTHTLMHTRMRLQVFVPCEVSTVCSETFHKHHPTESPCIALIDSYGCNTETEQCVQRSGYLNSSVCLDICHKRYL
jgi:hypothetical protein